MPDPGEHYPETKCLSLLTNVIPPPCSSPGNYGAPVEILISLYENNPPVLSRKEGAD